MEKLKKTITLEDARAIMKKFEGVVLFPEKVAKANEYLRISGLPKFPPKQNKQEIL